MSGSVAGWKRASRSAVGGHHQRGIFRVLSQGRGSRFNVASAGSRGIRGPHRSKNAIPSEVHAYLTVSTVALSALGVFGVGWRITDTSEMLAPRLYRTVILSPALWRRISLRSCSAVVTYTPSMAVMKSP